MDEVYDAIKCACERLFLTLFEQKYAIKYLIKILVRGTQTEKYLVGQMNF